MLYICDENPYCGDESRKSITTGQGGGHCKMTLFLYCVVLWWCCGAGLPAHNACVLSMLYKCWCRCMLFLKASLIVCCGQIMIHLIHLGVMHLHIGEVLNRRYGTPLPLTWFEIRWRHKGNMEGNVALNHSMSNTTVIHRSWDRGWIRNIPERW